MSGWIKIHRQITEWEWYNDANTFRLFMHLILKANHKVKNYRGVKIEVGCLMTGRELLSKETGLSIQQIRTCLERLKLTKEITIKTNKQGTVIQILKYEKYQVVTNEITTKQPTSNQQVTTNKNEENEKNEKEVMYRKFAHLSLSTEDFNKLDILFHKHDIENILDKIENYAKNKSYTSLYLTALNWLKRDCIPKDTATIKTKFEDMTNEEQFKYLQDRKAQLTSEA